jgi:TrmH family RNA methyltransferase
MYAELPTSVQNKPFIRLVSETLIEKISQTTSPSGLVTIFPIPATPSLATAQSGIVLVDISDPGNMGTLIRTCVALGKKTVVIIDGADVWSSKVILASAGTLAKASIFQTTWSTLVSQSTLPRSALVVEDGIPLQNAPTLEGLLIIGNEAHGIPESYLAQCTQKVTIEMPGKTESLNAAIAGSIAMYCAWIAKK